MYKWVRWQKNKERDNSNISSKNLNIYTKLSSNDSEFLLLEKKKKVVKAWKMKAAIIEEYSTSIMI